MEELSSFAQYMRTLPKYRRLSKAEETEYFRRIERDDESARAEFIGNNLYLVVSIATPFANTNDNNLLDLIQEGNIGLMEAVKKFDPKRGNRFSTHARWWVRQKIMRSLTNKGHTIRLPTCKRSKVKKIRDTGVILLTKFGRTASIEEIADELGEAPEEVRFLLQIANGPESLDAEIDSHSSEINGSGSEINRYEFIPDSNASTPYEHLVVKDDLRQLVSKVSGAIHRLSSVSGITPRTIKIFACRWGLDNRFKKLTLKEVGERFEITRERVKQIERICLRKLSWRGYDFGGSRGWEQTLENIKALAEMIGGEVSFSSLLTKETEK